VRGLNLFARAALWMAVAKRDRMTSAVRKGYLAPYDSWANRVAVQRFVQDIPMNASHPSYQTLVEVEQGLGQFRESPMKLIWGMKDWCFTPEFLEEFERRIPNADVTRFAEAGHYVFEDAREHLPSVIREFLQTHPLAGRVESP
jgi:haloalkane dehalogenase